MSKLINRFIINIPMTAGAKEARADGVRLLTACSLIENGVRVTQAQIVEVLLHSGRRRTRDRRVDPPEPPVANILVIELSLVYLHRDREERIYAYRVLFVQQPYLIEGPTVVRAFARGDQ